MHRNLVPSYNEDPNLRRCPNTEGGRLARVSTSEWSSGSDVAMAKDCEEGSKLGVIGSPTEMTA